mmetsp:Transcript_53304/g.148230  ORF Transcript_53304/g.148230 Transcript_53304/m.148230 type:complete len:271 (+) Transcript_53304:613-1425(+)
MRPKASCLLAPAAGTLMASCCGLPSPRRRCIFCMRFRTGTRSFSVSTRLCPHWSRTSRSCADGSGSCLALETIWPQGRDSCPYSHWCTHTPIQVMIRCVSTWGLNIASAGSRSGRRPRASAAFSRDGGVLWPRTMRTVRTPTSSARCAGSSRARAPRTQRGSTSCRRCRSKRDCDAPSKVSAARCGSAPFGNSDGPMATSRSSTTWRWRICPRPARRRRRWGARARGCGSSTARRWSTQRRCSGTGEERAPFYSPAPVRKARRTPVRRYI